MFFWKFLFDYSYFCICIINISHAKGREIHNVYNNVGICWV